MTVSTKASNGSATRCAKLAITRPPHTQRENRLRTNPVPLFSRTGFTCRKTTACAHKVEQLSVLHYWPEGERKGAWKSGNCYSDVLWAPNSLQASAFGDENGVMLAVALRYWVMLHKRMVVLCFALRFSLTTGISLFCLLGVFVSLMRPFWVLLCFLCFAQEGRG